MRARSVPPTAMLQRSAISLDFASLSCPYLHFLLCFVLFICFLFFSCLGGEREVQCYSALSCSLIRVFLYRVLAFWFISGTSILWIMITTCIGRHMNRWNLVDNDHGISRSIGHITSCGDHRMCDNKSMKQPHHKLHWTGVPSAYPNSGSFFYSLLCDGFIDYCDNVSTCPGSSDGNLDTF